MKYIHRVNKTQTMKGFSIIELMVVLAVAAVLAIGVTSYGAKLEKRGKVASDIRLQSELMQCTRNNKTGPSFLDVTLDTIIGSGCLDDLDVVSSDQKSVTNLFSGSVTVKVVAFNGNSNQGVEITTSGYSSDACFEVTKAVSKASPIVKVGSTDIKTLASPSYSPSTITGACSGSTNAITYTVAG